jgi:hypothetical protein
MIVYTNFPRGQEARVNDQERWERACAAATTTYDALPPGDRAKLDALIDEIMQIKGTLVEVVTTAGSSTVCRDCGGQCCLLGRYHVSILDLLAYRKTGAEPVAPVFSGAPACPYSDSSGCLMPPVYRPVTCVIFNCQPIEDLLPAADRERLQRCENRLRAAVSEAGSICRLRLERPLLLSD